MNLVPLMKPINTEEELQNFSNIYEKCSGLPIPEEYLKGSTNKVFGIYWRKKLIGGFILGRGPEFRTVSVFANEKSHHILYNQLGETELYTEICCFWIKKEYRSNAILNFFTWFGMTYALRRYGTKYFLFGTCSRSLANLYCQTSKSILIKKDFIKQKETFIFYAKRSSCVRGMLEIIKYKFGKAFKKSELIRIPARA